MYFYNFLVLVFTYLELIDYYPKKITPFNMIVVVPLSIYPLIITTTAILFIANVHLFIGFQFHDINTWLGKVTTWNAHDIEIISRNYERLFRLSRTVNHVFRCSISLILFSTIWIVIIQAFLTFDRWSVYVTNLTTLEEITTTIYEMLYQCCFSLIRLLMCGFLLRKINYGQYQVSIIFVCL